MAVITTEPMTISATASAQTKATLITRAGGSSLVQSVASGRVIAIVKTTGQSVSITTTSINNSITLKYVDGASAAVATIHGGNFTKYKTVSGVSSSAATVELYQTDRDIQRDVVDYIPRYYEDFRVVVEKLKTVANESTRMQAKLAELLDQFYVDTATIGLDRWEGIAQIEWLPQRSEGSRRNYIKGKLRGTGTVNVELLNEIVDAFYRFDVTELATENAVHFKLIGRRGIPKNLEDIQDAVNDVIPAHLVSTYEFTYLPWSEVTTAGLTWAQADGYTASGLEEAFLLPI